MELIPVHYVSEEELNHFLDKNDHVDPKKLAEHGYLVKIGETFEGCFVLDPLTEDVYWLRQLYINQKKADRLPFLLDAIVVLAKRKQMKMVYVHSHQPVVDLLLEALQFHKEQGNQFVDNPPRKKGRWWAYHVS